ncbi:hypothetical protein CK203_003838 [Vitis vinifera]|uniref:Uncharacterized protein n=1 Tax=Vitis vinifera TaxID=29760 RepID=A0A438K911_VITVI|nr:hypothetical protein CK203_003838 [Vitis vinifera]
MKVKYHSFGENSFCTGSAFASKVGSCVEDDGWIVSFVHIENIDVSQTCVVAALEMGTTPPAVPASTVSHGWLYFMRAFGSTRLLSSSEVLTGVYSDHFPTWGSAWIR